MNAKGLSFNEGKIIDASFVEAPKQRNSHEENKQIKAGNGDSLWNDKPHTTSHKDTDASVHDSNVIKPLVEESDKGQDLYLDAGYEAKDDVVRECWMTPIICEKGHRNHPLTDEQKRNNRVKSKTRCRVEHIFGFIETQVSDLEIKPFLHRP